ncbi:MAG: class I SAM-dependent methyltransferase [Candidatus Omnitrophica bacterium]|jgi:cyclopropane fatty-acyl-phospholipid synthase-like methyltransferase|nr:class I SAM-dependent methyltransferase [Candidatus Omnitrophota bacterium]MDD5079936.1 class I SAM-dependent methyltransferase [Candidatus Omnitrophota bacterium]
MSEIQMRDFNIEAADWDSEPRRVKLAEDIIEAIKSEIPLNPQMDIMDFGCGTGLVGMSLRPAVRSLVCVDNSQGMLDVLKGKISRSGISRVTTRRADVSRGGELDGDYDCIVSAMALHHIENIAGLARRFYQVLRNGGYVCIADLDPDNGKFHEDNAGVFHQGFEHDNLNSVFAQAGFADIRFRAAAEVEKPSGKYRVFLMVGSKKNS